MLPSPAGYSAKTETRSVMQVARAAAIRLKMALKSRQIYFVALALMAMILLVNVSELGARLPPLMSVSKTLGAKWYSAPEQPSPEWTFPLRQSTLMHADPEFTTLSNLVIVAGHAIYNGRSFDADSLGNESQWTLLPFQRGQTPAYLDHIRSGVTEAARDDSALLLFSGGQTRHESGPQSEAQNYWAIADALGWYGSPKVRSRALTEEFSRDSFENLLFSICRFHEITQRYPTNITMVSFGFKRSRFENLHAAALRFPPERFHFISSGDQYVDAHSESSAAAGPFSSDPYGCRSKVLREKRRDRNPFNRFLPYPEGCPALAPFFLACTERPLELDLPWLSAPSQ